MMSGQLRLVRTLRLDVIVVVMIVMRGGRRHVADDGRHMRVDGGRSGGCGGRRVVGVRAHCEWVSVIVGIRTNSRTFDGWMDCGGGV